MPFSPVVLFQSLSDPTRMRLMMLLSIADELCVCELTQALELSQPMTSRHLASLRAAGLVSDRRAGIWIHYRLHPDLPKWAQSVLNQTLTGVAKTQPFLSDRKALRAIPDRPATARCA